MNASLSLGAAGVLAVICLLAPSGRASGQTAPRAPAVTIVATPPSFETVEVPWPDELSGAPTLEYLVTPTGQLSVLGNLRGVLAQPGNTSVVLTLSVPRRARAGTIDVATVRFSIPGAVPVEVPIRVEVRPAAAIDLRLHGGEPVVVRGRRLQLRYTLANTGNRAEDVTVSAILPLGWRTPGADLSTSTLAVNEVREYLLVMDVPESNSTGAARVRLVASIGEQPMATVEAMVSVLAEPRRQYFGPRLTTGLVIAGGQGTGVGYGVSALIDGPLAPGIRVFGRFQGFPGDRSAGGLLLRRLGGFGLPPILQLDGSSWRVAAGHTGMRAGDLAGYNLAGTGASGTLRSGRWTATALAARPGSGLPGDRRDGLLATGRIEVNGGPVLLAATGSHLAEHAFEDRRLDAFGLSATIPALWQGELSTELAHRRFAAGEGLGYTARFLRRTRNDNLSLQVVHAPGGRTAFAPASDQLHLQANRFLTGRVGIQGGYWHTRDGATASFSRLASEGYNGSANIRVTDWLSLGLGGRRSRFQASSTTGGFATTEEAVEADLSLSWRNLFARGRSAFGATRRETALSPDLPNVLEGGRRVVVDGAIGSRSDAGLFSLRGRYDASAGTSRGLPAHADLAALAENIPLVGRGEFQIRGMAELRRSFWPGFGPSHTGVLAGLTADLPLGFALELSMERNPFFVSVNGSPGWLYGIRIERSTGLPAIAREEARGVVYRDLNRNARRDPDEPGHAGAVIRRGDQAAVSDQNGVYRLSGVDGGHGALDPFSLGNGWITGQEGVVDGRREIAVIPVAPVVVILQIEDDQGIGTPDEVLSPAAVLVRDEAGQIWIARRDGPAHAYFDALPTGRYTLELDLMDVAEPLRVLDSLPAIIVRGGERAEPITVRLAPRTMQIRMLDPGGATQ